MDSVAQEGGRGAWGTAGLGSVTSRCSARRAKEWSDSVNKTEIVNSVTEIDRGLGSAGTTNSVSVPVAWVSCQHVCLRTFGLLTWLRAPEGGFQQMLPLTLSFPTALLCLLKRSQTCRDPRGGDRDRPHPLACRKKFWAMFSSCHRNLLTVQAHWQLPK